MNKQRLNPYQLAPDAMQAMVALDRAVTSDILEPSLIDLVKTRASQLNGCAYCVFMHTRDARAAGEREERLYLLDAWQESSLYTERERAALAWTEAVTGIATTHAPDAIYTAAREHLNDVELAQLTVLIATINAWNRIAIALRIPHPRAHGATGGAG